MFGIFIYSYIGDKINEEVKVWLSFKQNFNLFNLKSENVSTQIYETNWIEAPLSMQRDLCFIMNRSQKALTVRSVIFNANKESFATVRKENFLKVF